MTKKEEMRRQRRAYREKIASLSPKEKWQYFKDYYLKGTVVCIVVLLILMSLCRDVWRSSRECVFYALVVNNYSEVPDAFRSGFISYAQLDEEKNNIVIDTTMQIDLARMDAMTVNYLQEIIALSSTRTQDIFLADEKVIAYYWDAGYIVDIRDALPTEFWGPLEERFYYLPDQNGDEVPVGFQAADSPRLKEFGMYENQQPIISVVYQAPNTETIQEFISYLLLLT